MTATYINDFITKSEIPIVFFLYHKGIVNEYDNIFANFLRNNPKQSAEIIVKKFLIKTTSDTETVFLPSSLQITEFESILQKYIDLKEPNYNIVQLIVNSKNTDKFPMSNNFLYNAQSKYVEMQKQLFNRGTSVKHGLIVNITPNDEIELIKHVNDSVISIIYDRTWIENHLDCATLLNNFIFLFEFVDWDYICNFTSKSAEIGVLEGYLSGYSGEKIYKTGICYNFRDAKSTLEIKSYANLLKLHDINIEDVMEWFFTMYLPKEFDVNEFVFNKPSKNTEFLEKCRFLLPELEGIIKQFNIYVQDGKINRDKFELTSKPLVFKDIRSLLKNKYVYAQSKEIKNEICLCCSSQSVLPYTEKYGIGYKSFIELLENHSVYVTDQPKNRFVYLDWLKERGSIDYSNDGRIIPNKPRLDILNSLYKNQVFCPYWHPKSSLELEKLINTGDVIYGESLLSIPEQQYFNFVFNKSEFSNGLDIRNRYIHNTNSLDKQQQEYDYYRILKMMIVLILKINEEFILNDVLNNCNNGDAHD